MDASRGSAAELHTKIALAYLEKGVAVSFCLFAGRQVD
jgi:hypothetical protein